MKYFNFAKLGKDIDPAAFTEVGRLSYYIYQDIWGTEAEIDFELEVDESMYNELEAEINELDLGPSGEGCNCAICGHRIKKAAFITQNHMLFYPIGLDCARSIGMANLDESAIKGELLKKRQQRIRAEKIAEIYATYPNLEQDLADSKNKLVDEIRANFKTHLTISEKQVALVAKIVAEERKKKLDVLNGVIKPLPDGAASVTVTVVSQKINEIDDVYGPSYGKLAHKIKEATIIFSHVDGWKACYKGSSKFLTQEIPVGSEVSLLATFSKSSRDVAFGFISKPSQITIKRVSEEVS